MIGFKKELVHLSFDLASRIASEISSNNVNTAKFTLIDNKTKISDITMHINGNKRVFGWSWGKQEKNTT